MSQLALMNISFLFQGAKINERRIWMDSIVGQRESKTIILFSWQLFFSFFHNGAWYLCVFVQFNFWILTKWKNILIEM